VASAAAPDSLAGSVLALTPSQWTQARSDGVERVAMQGGWLRVHVRPQAAGERFLVTMPDGEIEVRGTTFDVAVDGASTTRVHVDDGVVELRLNGLAAERLGPGSTWPPPAPAAVPALPPTAGNSAPSPTTRPPASTSPGVVDRAASAYRDAMQLLLEGHDADAASAFAAFVVAHPGAPQVEDASYLEAVALARAGRVDAAALAAEQYLRRFPKAFHGKEAAALAVRAASLRGDCVHVRALVAAWSAGEPDPDERAALKVCEGR
jgi:hypothetical protein